jgi:hypothetical protein
MENVYCKSIMSAVSKILHRKIFIVECNLSDKLKNDSFPDTCLYEIIFFVFLM